MKSNYAMCDKELQQYLEFKNTDNNLASSHLYSSIQYADTFQNHLLFSRDYFFGGNHQILQPELYNIWQLLFNWLMHFFYSNKVSNTVSHYPQEYELSIIDFFVLYENINSFVIQFGESKFTINQLSRLNEMRDALISISQKEGIVSAYEAEAYNTYIDLMKLEIYDTKESKQKCFIENRLFNSSLKIEKMNLSSSCYYLGYCYEYGIGTDINLKKAIKYYKKAVKFSMECPVNHSRRSLSALAKLYIKVGDYPTAIKQYEKGIELRDPYCIYQYALLLLNGDIIPTDKKRAKKLIYDIRDYNIYDQNIGESNSIIDERIWNLIEGEDELSSWATRIKIEKLNSLLNLESKNNFPSYKYIVDEQHTMKMLVPTNYLIEKSFDAQLNQLFGANLGKLSPQTKEMIVNSLILFHEFKEKPILKDYSPLVLSLFKALEIELSLNFYQNHIKYLIAKPPTAHVISAKCKTKNGNLKTTFDDFTLGKIDDLIFNTQNANLNDFKTGAFYYYFINDYVSPQYNNYNGRHWYNYFDQLCFDIATIRQRYRNPTVHYDPIIFEKALDCFDFFFYSTNILNRIVQYKR